MPDWYKQHPDKVRRNGERKRNYEKGRFWYGDKFRPYDWWEKVLAMAHVISDRELAWYLRRSANGIQAMRWRLKKSNIV